MSKPNILDHFRSGKIIIGDGSYVFTLERRGYVLAGAWTPEVAVQHPEALRQLTKEYARAGANVIQAFIYNGSDNMLAYKGTQSESVTSLKINEVAVRIAKEEAALVDAFVCGALSNSTTFMNGGSEDEVRAEFRSSIDSFMKADVDLLLAEFFKDIQEAEIAISEMRQAAGPKFPIGISMVVGPTGDRNNVSPQECAVRLKQAGADIIGLNCGYDPNTSLKVMALMKQGLTEAGLGDTFLIVQPCGFHCQETEGNKKGFYALPEYPFALEPRVLTRLDCYDFARKAFNLGVHWIGGCCGMEPLHIRALAMELEEELGRKCPGRDHADKWAETMALSSAAPNNKGSGHWTNLVPATGRQIRTYADNKQLN